jgi:DNA-binding Xre family transcriptional regulator
MRVVSYRAEREVMLMQKKVQLNRRLIQMRLTELGETIATISERSELGQATWYRIVNNPGWNWKAETLATLAKELQCSPTDLIETEGYPSPLVEAPAVSVV